MSYFIEKIRHKINEGQLDQAQKLLLTTLKNGKRSLYDEVAGLDLSTKSKSRSRRSRDVSSGNHAGREKLLGFLQRLERDEPDMMMFLAHLELGKSLLSKGEWMTARFNFESAMKLHSSAYMIGYEEVNGSIQLCDDAMAFNQFIETGNEYYNLKSWTHALQNFNQAISHHREDFNFDLTELKNVMNICNKGVHFDRSIKEARSLISQSQWREAKQAYHRALVLHEEEFSPNRSQLNAAIQSCHNKEIAVSRRLFNFDMSRMAINYVLVGGIMFMFVLFLYRSTSGSDQTPPQRYSIENVQSADSVHNKVVNPRPAEQEKSENYPAQKVSFDVKDGENSTNPIE